MTVFTATVALAVTDDAKPFVAFPDTATLDGADGQRIVAFTRHPDPIVVTVPDTLDPADAAHAVAEHAWALTNLHPADLTHHRPASITDTDLAWMHRYRAAKRRSMSVGDIVTVHTPDGDIDLQAITFGFDRLHRNATPIRTP